MNTQRSKNIKGFFLKVIYMMLIMSVTYMIIDLYSPIKSIINGEGFSLDYMLSCIDLRKHVIFIVVMSIILSIGTLSQK